MTETIHFTHRQFMPRLTRLPTLSITSFSPSSGPAGTVVTITGTGFTDVSCDVTAVDFNGTAVVTFTVDSATQITATVPAGTTTGPITVTTPCRGSATSASNFVLSSVTIRINGTAYGPFATNISEVSIYDLGPYNDVAETKADFRNVKIGTGGYGSSDLFSSTLSSGPVPPWDAIYISGTATGGISGGVLATDVPVASYYIIEKNLAAETEVWMQFQIRFDAATVAANPQPGIIDLYGSGYSGDVGLYPATMATGLWYAYAGFGNQAINDVPVTAGSWITIDIYIIT